MRRYSLLVVAVLLVTVVACEFPITRATERAWQENFREALIAGHADFKGLDVDSDTGFYVFSYTVPVSLNMTAAVPTLRDQITRHKPCFQPILETPTELQMRCRIRTLGENGFDEYRALFDAGERRVTVMFGNFDSASEQQRYEHFVSDFRSAHLRRR